MHTLAIDARMIDASGIGVYLKNIIPFLLTEFHVTLLGDPEKLSVFAETEQAKLIPLTSPIYSLKEQLELKNSLPACDIFWSPHYNIPLLPLKAQTRVVTIHDTFHLAYKHTLSLPQRLYATTLLNAAVRLSDKVITVSDFSKQELGTYTKCKPSKIEVIYNGVDQALFNENTASITPQELGRLIPDLPEKYILYVGNVKPHKNLITLLKAFSCLSPALQQTYQLVIVGKKEGFLTPEVEVFKFLEKRPHSRPFIHFSGFIEDTLLPFLYKYASLSVFPSLYEGFGLPPLEAMACGCPVIASNAASIPEVCGDAALYFAPLQIDDLKKQLELVLQSPALQKDLKQKGRNQSLKFNWKASAMAHLRVFKEVLGTADV